MDKQQKNYKLKQLPKTPSSEENMNLLVRTIIAAILFIVGFNFSYSAFFKENPLYGIRFLAETLISISSGLFGFYVVPRSFFKIKYWLETLIINTVNDIVGNFWEQQTKRINEKKREKQKKEAEEYKKKLKEQLSDGIVVDTSVLIDGRISDIVRVGFLEKTLVIPSVVMNELHAISDNQNKLKRDKGRRGLDIVKKLKNYTKVFIPEIKLNEHGVDGTILEFAKINKIKLMTQDFNLNKLAQASGVKVLNINELVEAVKVSALPGENFTIKISHEGKEKSQGVGYMVDGTMIVVEDARSLVGQEVSIKVLRVIQSPAGKIIFADLVPQVSNQPA